MIDTFKICPNCRKGWSTQAEFISDNELELNGYAADFKKLEKGLFFFTHKAAGCFSTLAIETKDFLNLYHGPHYEEQKAETEDCPGYCLDRNQLNRCEELCECAFVREICNIIREQQGALCTKADPKPPQTDHHPDPTGEELLRAKK